MLKLPSHWVLVISSGLIFSGASAAEEVKVVWSTLSHGSFLECPNASHELHFAKHRPKKDDDLGSLPRGFVKKEPQFQVDNVTEYHNGFYVCRQKSCKESCWRRLFHVDVILKNKSCIIWNDGRVSDRKTIAMCLFPDDFCYEVCQSFKNTKDLKCIWKSSGYSYDEGPCESNKLVFGKLKEVHERKYFLYTRRAGYYQGVVAAINLQIIKNTQQEHCHCACKQRRTQMTCRAPLQGVTEKLNLNFRLKPNHDGCETELKANNKDMITYCNLGIRVKARLNKSFVQITANMMPWFALYDKKIVLSLRDSKPWSECDISFKKIPTRHFYSKSTIVIILVCTVAILAIITVFIILDGMKKCAVSMVQSITWKYQGLRYTNSPSFETSKKGVESYDGSNNVN